MWSRYPSVLALDGYQPRCAPLRWRVYGARSSEPGPVFSTFTTSILASPGLIASRIRRAPVVYDAHELYGEPQ